MNFKLFKIFLHENPIQQNYVTIIQSMIYELQQKWIYITLCGTYTLVVVISHEKTNELKLHKQ